MKKNINTNEEIIKFLLSLEKKSQNHKIIVSVNRDKFNNSVLSNILTENEFIDKLLLLESDNYISLNFPAHKDLKYYIEIFLTPKSLHYFENKKQNKKLQREKHLNEFRAWVTLIIAIIGLILSIYNTFYINETKNNDNKDNSIIMQEQTEALNRNSLFC